MIFTFALFVTTRLRLNLLSKCQVDIKNICHEERKIMGLEGILDNEGLAEGKGGDISAMSY